MATVGEKDLLVVPSPPINSDQILSEYPLHWYVWNKDASSIEEELALAKVSAHFVNLTSMRKSEGSFIDRPRSADLSSSITT